MHIRTDAAPEVTVTVTVIFKDTTNILKVLTETHFTLN